jgi:tetratricopeptide (TPR) repeat protein
MKATGKLIVALLLAISMSGCASTLQRLQNMLASPTDRYREMALAFEKQDEPQQAILCWEAVAQLAPAKQDVPKIIADLKRKAAKAARGHFQRGLEQYQAGDLNKAMREFLIAIRLDPGNEQARYYLKTRLQNPDQTVYRVQPGDSFIKIASDVYKDPTKAYWVAYFNDLDPRKPLQIGTNLLLPALEKAYLIPRSDIQNLLAKARKAFEKKHYTRVYSLTEAILKEIPNHPQASKLADAARFDQGMDLMRQKHYLAAIELFKQISPRYPKRDAVITKARDRVRRQAIDVKLEEARRLLRSAAWGSVINATEEILKQDPNNDKAKMLFSNASYKLGKLLLDRGQAVKAIEVLSRIEPSYEDAGQLLSLARARVKAQAEVLYRDGVKQFINEDLERAIQTWKKVLELNPDHLKARQDMENAQRLLEKLRALDKKPADATEQGDRK